MKFQFLKLRNMNLSGPCCISHYGIYSETPERSKTVPYSLFYIAVQTYKWSVGRDTLIPPRRSLADCSNANLSEWNSAILRCAQDRSVACIPHWGLHCWTSFNKRELVGARPLHLAIARPFCRLHTPLGYALLNFIQQTRIWHFVFIENTLETILQSVIYWK